MSTKDKNSDTGVTKNRKPLLIENVFEKETTESFIERHFPDRFLHRCRVVDHFNVDAIADQYASTLIRSAQDLEPNPEGKRPTPTWSMLLFKQPGNVFWHFLIKSSGTYGEKENLKEFTLTVTAPSPAEASRDAMMLQKHFVGSDDAPGFFLVRDIRRPQRIPLKPEYALSPSMLDLHYGTGFHDWTNQFAAGLAENGLSILRGKPGTGKTSFLRHLIFTFASTHRFYYLPVDAFGLLQEQMAGFLTRQQKRFPDTVLVLVLEDAEHLLLNRHSHRDGLASSLLNFTDGFIGDLVKAHLICTINSEVKDLDGAVLRPGRQRFFREFDLLPWPQARALAEKLGITLKEERNYSLAELYHFKDLLNEQRLPIETERMVGFAQS
jgi:hypothetical protein